MSARDQKYISLEYIRGFAAITVAISHYMMRLDANPTYEYLAVIAVEVFFPLSGFVLARQIVYVTKNRKEVGVFLLRRWMRTIPPYVLALGIISMIVDEVFSGSFFQYLFFLKYLNTAYFSEDYFPIAWSLAVEEWYYILFPVLLMAATGGKIKGKNLLLCSGIAIFFVVLSRFIVSIFVEPSFVRIGSFLRLDSICIGFIFFLIFHNTTKYRCIVWTSTILCILCGLLYVAHESGVSIATDGQFILAFAPIFFATLITLLSRLEGLSSTMAWRPLQLIGRWFGGISYSVYLFHLIILYLLFPNPSDSNLFLFCPVLLGICTLFYLYFERPIMKIRPRYKDSMRTVHIT